MPSDPPSFTPAPPPPDELERQRSLDRLGVLDTPAEARFDRLVGLGRRLLGVEVALVSLVDRDRQWFKATAGLEASQTPRDISFCGHAIHGDDLFIVPDATRDPRFAGNPLVVDGPRIRLYAGVPLSDPHGFKLGTLCIIDGRPRELNPSDARVLRDLGRIAERELADDPRSPVQRAFIESLGIELSGALDPVTRSWGAEAGLEILERELELAHSGSHRVGVAVVRIEGLPAGGPPREAWMGALARTLRAELRDCDLLARWRETAFLVGLPHATMEQTRQVAERLSEAVTACDAPADQPARDVGAWVGTATTAVLPDADAAWLVAAAEDAAHTASIVQKGRVAVAAA
jgi:GGDEF domain-containing protein